jgi:Ser/Thr protein kinase RdoA (MazF antagonist)
VTDAAVVGRLLAEYHDRAVPPSRIRRLSGSVQGSRVSYQVQPVGGASQVIRAFRADGGVPAVHGVLPGSVTVADWLLGRARTLAYLELAGYPAPRPVLTRTGELVGVAGPWLSWATTDVPGSVVQPTRHQLRLLGAALGQLHCLPPDGLAAASADPRTAVPAIRARLAAASRLAPPSLRELQEEISQLTSAVGDGADRCARSAVHGDAWARNVVQPESQSVVLLDWETGGAGLAVLDLGHCLMECHLDALVPDNEPEAWLIEADEHRIAAVCSGYAGARTLSAAEIALLPAAVRFAAAVVGTIHLEAALLAGVTGPSMDARLARLRNRLRVGAAVATMAQRHLSSGSADA